MAGRDVNIVQATDTQTQSRLTSWLDRAVSRQLDPIEKANMIADWETTGVLAGLGGKAPELTTGSSSVAKGELNGGVFSADTEGFGLNPEAVQQERVPLGQRPADAQSSWEGYLTNESEIQSTSGNDTPHVIVSSGKAPEKGIPNSIYEVSRADGSKSITYYDSMGNTFSREDYGQQQSHGQLGYGSDGRALPHEHKIEYNSQGFPIGKYYREIDSNGRPVGDWIKG